MTTATDAHTSWARHAVTFRLSKKRRDDLMFLMADQPTPLLPTAAIDHAIAVAVASQSSQALIDSDNLADGLRLLAAQSKSDAVEQRRALADMAKHVKELRDVIAAVASAGEQGESEYGEGALPMRQWLDQEALLLPKRSFIAKVQWQSKCRLDDLSVSLDLLVERIAAADLQGAATRGRPAIVRIAPVGPENPLCRADSMSDFYLMCQGTQLTEWLVALHPIQPDGKPAPKIGTFLL